MANHITNKPVVVTEYPRILQNALLTNALFTSICGLSLLIYASRINVLFGTESFVNDHVLQIPAIALTVYAVILFLVAMRPAIHSGHAWTVIVLDALLVLDSAFLLLLRLPELTVYAEITVGIFALLRAALVLIQWKGILEMDMFVNSQAEHSKV